MTLRILLIDDSPDDVEHLTALALKADSSFEFSIAADGVEAMNLLGSNSVDCILLDYRLENEDGRTLLPKLLDASENCPIIMLTGQGSETVAAAAIKGGAADYMAKHEVTGTDLRTAVTRAVERALMQAKIVVQEQELLRQGRLEALGQLSAGIAHDFNNLLATIKFGVDGVRRSPGSQNSAERLDMVMTTIDRATERVQSLLAFASKQVGRMSTQMSSDVFREIRGLAKNPISSSCKIIFQPCEPNIPVVCDQGLLQSALLNVIINARDAIVEAKVDGVIRVSAAVVEDGTFIEFSVSDNGVGIPDNLIDRVVDPYFTTKQERGGSGLGLSMVHGFVQQNGGNLHIDSEMPGTTVRFTVPVGSIANVETRESESESVRSNAVYRVLVVEDEALLARMIEFDLEDAGYEVEVASTAPQALELISNSAAFDVLVTDISLGGKLDGFDVARKARELQPNIKTIGISGFFRFDEYREAGIIDGMLSKPFQQNKLLDLLNNLSKMADA